MFGQLPQFHLKVVPRPRVLTLNTQVHSIFLQPCAPGKAEQLISVWRMPGAKALVALVFAGAFGPFARLPRKATLGHAGGFGDRGYPILGGSSMVEMVSFSRGLVVMNPMV